MTKATERTTTIPTRRALLAGAPAAAAAALAAGGAVNIVATAKAKSSADRPIFAAIERHRKARSEEKRTHLIFQEHADERSFGDAEVVVGEESEKAWKKVKVDGLVQLHEYRTGVMVSVTARSEKEIADYAPSDLSEPERAAWIRARTAELQRREAIERAHYKSTPRSVTWHAWNDACNAVEAATKQLAETRPKTIAGAVALLRYLSELYVDDLDDDDIADNAVLMMDAIADALAKLA